MKFRVVLGWFVFFAICGFCHKDFKSLGRHEWRCRKKLNDQQEDIRQKTYSSDSSSIQLDHGNNEIEEANERLLSSNSEISCVCGKVCKSNRGLKTHQRACRTIRGLNRELTNALHSYDHDNEDEITIVHSISSGKVEMFLCAACHVFPPHVNAWKR